MRPFAAFAAAVSALISLGGLASRHRAGEPSKLSEGAEAARIEVLRPRGDTTLERRPGGWTVERHGDAADGEAVDELLAGLRSLEFGRPVAPRGAAKASGLGPADAVNVRVLDAGGCPLFDGWFGRRLFGRTAYFRARDGDAIRLATGVDPELLLRTSSAWREPRALPGGCPDGLEVRARGAWKPAPPPIAQELCALSASEWATGTPEGLGGFERPLLRARTPDGRGFTVGERRGAQRLVRVDGRNALLRVPAAAIETAAADVIGSQP